MAKVHEMSELFDKEVNAEKESLKTYQGSHKSTKKCEMKMNERKQGKKEKNEVQVKCY